MSDKGKIFVVDDDDAIRELLAGYLQKNGFEVSAYPDGESFLQDFACPERSEGHQLVVLDIMMPGIDGYEVVRRLRELSMIPVIMLTAVSDDVDRIVGLELGADDYLAKPFNPRELLARIKAIVRRIEAYEKVPDTAKSGTDQRYCRFNHFCIDTVSRNLTLPDGRCAGLSGSDYSLLMLFVEHAGQVVSREDIARLTRSRKVLPMDRFIDVQISRLRHQLEDDARNPSIIKTVRGKGYVMATEVSFCDA
ncbi:response regulator [Endozoicomonadaceae bacterium StTr2]